MRYKEIENIDFANTKTAQIIMSIGERFGAYNVNNSSVISKYTHTTCSTTANIIKALNEHKLITKQRTGRYVTISLTASGKKIKNNLLEIKKCLKDL